MRNRQHTKVHLFSRSTPTEDTNEDTPELGTIVNEKRKKRTTFRQCCRQEDFYSDYCDTYEYADGQISPILSAVKNHTNAHNTVRPSGQHLRAVLSVL